MKRPEFDERAVERQKIEDVSKKNLNFSRRFRRTMGAVALLAGAWLPVHGTIDASSKSEHPQSSSAPSTADYGGSLAVISIATAAAALEKRKTNKKINDMVSEYGGKERGAGFSSTSLVVDGEGDFSEVYISHEQTLNDHVNTIIDPLTVGLKTFSLGLGAIVTGELIKSFTSPDLYQNVWSQRVAVGGGLLITGTLLALPFGAESAKLQSVSDRLGVIDQDIGFEV